MSWIIVDISKEKTEEDRPTEIQTEKWYLAFCNENCMKKRINLM